MAEWIVGSDEAGFGSWAGPLVVAGTALPRGWKDDRVKDSKEIKSRTKKAKIFRQWALETPVIWHAVSVSNDEIDKVGVWKALCRAHRQVLENLLAKVEGDPLIVVDGFPQGTVEIGVPGAIGLPEADAKIPAVSLASIFAKVSHDNMMVELAKIHTGYGFQNNVGYHSKEHVAGLDLLGPCPIHRKSYSPIAKRLNQGTPEAWLNFPSE